MSHCKKHNIFATTIFINLIYVSSLGSHPSEACLKSNLHKKSPSAEDPTKMGVCSVWWEHSCCTSDTATKISDINSKEFFYNILWDQCPHIKNMSERCKSRFLRESCFYQCASMMAPWIVTKPQNSSQPERILDVPMCRNDCEDWFDACMNDYTCSDVWSSSRFSRSIDGKSGCKQECKTFKEYHGNSQQFCQNIFSGSYQYVKDSSVCCLQISPVDDLNSNFECANNHINYNMGIYFSLILASMAIIMTIAGIHRLIQKRKSSKTIVPIRENEDIEMM